MQPVLELLFLGGAGICGVGVAAGWRCADAPGNRNVFGNLNPLQKWFSKQEKQTL